MKDFFTNVRLRLSLWFIRMAIWIINKNTLEGMSLVMSIDSWAGYLEQAFKEQSENISINYKIPKR